MNKLPLIPIDKANHFVYGVIIYTLFNLVFHPLISLIFLMVISIGKEVYDYLSDTGTPDYKDALWTLMGGNIVFLNHFL
jgi:hypothetical protein